jgi:hypothetical protein
VLVLSMEREKLPRPSRQADSAAAKGKHVEGFQTRRDGPVLRAAPYIAGGNRLLWTRSRSQHYREFAPGGQRQRDSERSAIDSNRDKGRNRDNPSSYPNATSGCHSNAAAHCDCVRHCNGHGATNRDNCAHSDDCAGNSNASTNSNTRAQRRLHHAQHRRHHR